MKIGPLAAFAGVAALSAVAFAPAITSTDAGSTGPRDGLAAAFAAGELELDLTAAPSLGDVTQAGVPFGVTAPCTAGFAGPFPTSPTRTSRWCSAARR